MTRFWKSGEPFIWLTGGGLAIGLIMVVGLVLLIRVSGLGFFWPSSVVRLTLNDGRVIMGQVTEREQVPENDARAGTPPKYRIKIKQGLGADRPLRPGMSVVAHVDTKAASGGC